MQLAKPSQAFKQILLLLAIVAILSVGVGQVSALSASGTVLAELSGGANMIRPMASNVSGLSSVVAKGRQVIHFVSSTPSYQSMRMLWSNQGWPDHR